jgi:hypothetical protein
MINTRDALELLLHEMEPEVPDEAKVDLITRLSWMGWNNGQIFSEIRIQWILEEVDEFLPIALLPWEVGITNTRKETDQILQSISHRREFQGRIEELLDGYD